MRYYLALVAALAASPAPAQVATPPSGDCPQHFLGGQRPRPVAPVVGEVSLCSTSYAVEWSPETRNPIYSAEYLTGDSIAAASRLTRSGKFSADLRLPAGARAVLADYRGSSYDRGHMSPDHDMPSAAAQAESYELSNVVPQDPDLNQGEWAAIEATVRGAIGASTHGEGWVVTGPAYAPITGVVPSRLHGRVAIPLQIWKAVYVPSRQPGVAPIVGAWYSRNAPVPETRFLSIDALTRLVGTDPFPGLSAELRARAQLPTGAARRTGATLED